MGSLSFLFSTSSRTEGSTHSAAGPAHTRAARAAAIAGGIARRALIRFLPWIVALITIQFPRSHDALSWFQALNRRRWRRGRSHGGSWRHRSRRRLSAQALRYAETQSNRSKANRLFHFLASSEQGAPLGCSPECPSKFPHRSRGGSPPKIPPGCPGAAWSFYANQRSRSRARSSSASAPSL